MQHTTPVATPLSTGRRLWVGEAFDWVMVGFSSLLVGGFYLDGWAHLHRRTAGSIITPWHLLLYFSAVATTLFLLLHWWRIGGDTKERWKRFPAAYRLSLLGIGFFFVGAAADPLWHLRFGIEVDIETLLSPPHLLLGACTILVVTGPFRARWRTLPQEGPVQARAVLPLVISLTVTLALFTFYTEFLHPVVNPWAGVTFMARYTHKRTLPAIGEAIGIASILFQSSVLIGVILLMVRRWQLPFGSITLLCGVHIALLAVLRDEYRMIPMAIVSGLLADWLIVQWRPSLYRVAALRCFAFTVPVIFYGLYFLTIAGTEGIRWSVHLWVGTLVLAGVMGLLMSVLVVPPALDGADQQ